MTDFEYICGENIFITLEDFFTTKNKNYIKYILLNNNNEVTSIFGGEIDNNNILESSYTCSKEIPRGGLLLRFYALLQANNKNKNITKIIGGISGGIPSIQITDNPEDIERKKEVLINYHIKNGAIVYDNNSKFEYTIDNIKLKIPELFQIKFGGKKRKTKKRKTQKRKYKSNSKKTKRI